MNDWPQGFVPMMRDDTAPHQIRIRVDTYGKLYRSCTCRPKQGGWNGGNYGVEPMEYIDQVPIDVVLAHHQLHVAEAEKLSWSN